MISDRLNQANGRLQSSKVGVKLEQAGNRLYLRATLPPKPTSLRNSPHQQRIGLRVHANPAGVKLAESEARKVGALVDCKEFCWNPYLKLLAKPEAVSDWVSKFETDYFNSRGHSGKTLTTWKKDYLAVFKQLPNNQELSPALLKHTVLSTEPNTKTRRRYYSF